TIRLRIQDSTAHSAVAGDDGKIDRAQLNRYDHQTKSHVPDAAMAADLLLIVVNRSPPRWPNSDQFVACYGRICCDEDRSMGNGTYCQWIMLTRFPASPKTVSTVGTTGNQQYGKKKIALTRSRAFRRRPAINPNSIR